MKRFLKSKLSAMTICAMASMSLLGCNDDSETQLFQTEVNAQQPNDNVGTPNQSSENTISGKLVSYDGETPIANALVYAMPNSNDANSQNLNSVLNFSTGISSNTVDSSNEGLECGIAPEGSLASTCTSADGSYSLNLTTTAESLIVKFEKGAFTAEQLITLDIASDSSEAGVTTLANTALEVVPKMVVIKGAYDSIELILARLGLSGAKDSTDTEADFELWKTADNLFVDSDNNGKANIFNFDMVFFNCGQEDSGYLSDSNRQILKEYVEAGGRIYVSDQAYDIVEQTFPEYIDFYGSNDTPVDQPELLNAAETGIGGISIISNVEPKLKAWLQGVSCIDKSCLNEDGTVTIEGFLSLWTRMESVANNNKVDVYVTGLDSDNTMRPLTAAFNYGEGRVTYTSYHNEEEHVYCPEGENYDTLAKQCKPSSDTGQETLTPQQRILQYLVFEL